MRIMHGQQHIFSTAEELFLTLLWRHNGRDGVSDHQHRECSLNRLSRRRSKKTSKLRATGLFVGNSPVTGEFPAQRASNADNVSIWWRHHENDRIIMRWRVARWYSNSRPFSFMANAQTSKLQQRDIFQLMIRHAGSVDNDILFCKSLNTKCKPCPDNSAHFRLPIISSLISYLNHWLCDLQCFWLGHWLGR